MRADERRRLKGAVIEAERLIVMFLRSWAKDVTHNGCDYAEAFGMARVLHLMGVWEHAPSSSESHFQKLVSESLDPSPKRGVPRCRRGSRSGLGRA